MIKQYVLNVQGQFLYCCKQSMKLCVYGLTKNVSTATDISNPILSAKAAKRGKHLQKEVGFKCPWLILILLGALYKVICQ